MGTTIGRGTGNRPYDVYDKAETVSKANNKVAMTFSDLQGLGSVIQIRGMVNYDKLSTLKVQVNAATTQADLDKIVW